MAVTQRDLIDERSRFYYLGDVACRLEYEPSGEDFLSPCIAEADLMRRVGNGSVTPKVPKSVLCDGAFASSKTSRRSFAWSTLGLTLGGYGLQNRLMIVALIDV